MRNVDSSDSIRVVEPTDSWVEDFECIQRSCAKTRRHQMDHKNEGWSRKDGPGQPVVNKGRGNVAKNIGKVWKVNNSHWDPYEDEDGEDDSAWPEKNTKLDDWWTWMATMYLSTKQRSQWYSYDFDSNGNVRRERIPKGRFPVIRAHGLDWLLVYRGYYIFTGDVNDSMPWLLTQRDPKSLPQRSYFGYVPVPEFYPGDVSPIERAWHTKLQGKLTNFPSVLPDDKRIDLWGPSTKNPYCIVFSEQDEKVMWTIDYFWNLHGFDRKCSPEAMNELTDKFTQSDFDDIPLPRRRADFVVPVEPKTGRPAKKTKVASDQNPQSYVSLDPTAMANINHLAMQMANATQRGTLSGLAQVCTEGDLQNSPMYQMLERLERGQQEVSLQFRSSQLHKEADEIKSKINALGSEVDRVRPFQQSLQVAATHLQQMIPTLDGFLGSMFARWKDIEERVDLLDASSKGDTTSGSGRVDAAVQTDNDHGEKPDENDASVPRETAVQTTLTMAKNRTRTMPVQRETAVQTDNADHGEEHEMNIDH